jgi:hypothetical protein
VIPGKRTLYFGTLPLYRGRGDLEMLGRLIAFVRSMATDRGNEFIRVRAGAVGIGGAAILLPTLAERGLNGLVASLVSLGAEALADDMTRIDPILHQVHPLALPLLLDPDDLALFSDLGRTPTRMRRRITEFQRQAMHRQPVAPQELGGALGTEPTPIRWIVFPEFARDDETHLEPAGGAQSLFRFAETRLNLHVWGDRTLVLMRDLLEESPVSRLVVGSAGDAARLVLETAPSMVGGVTA